MSNPLDELSNYVTGDDEKPVDKPVPAPVAPAPRASGDNLPTLKERALQGLPAEWRERAIRDAGECGVRHDNDVGWLLIGSSVQSLFCAFAAGDAAQAVQAGVSQIPDQIFNGAVRASDEVKGGLVVGAKAFVEAFSKAANDRQAALIAAVDAQQSSILSAATVGADKIKLAAVSLTSSLDAAVKAKTDEGVADFAKAAAAAGKAAAEASMWAQISRSAMVSVLAFIFACMVGAGGLWGYLLLNHEVMPAGVIAVSDPLRGPGTLVSIPNGGTPVHDCAGGLCVYYKSPVPDLP